MALSWETITHRDSPKSFPWVNHRLPLPGGLKPQAHGAQPPRRSQHPSGLAHTIQLPPLLAGPHPPLLTSGPLLHACQPFLGPVKPFPQGAGRGRAGTLAKCLVSQDHGGPFLECAVSPTWKLNPLQQTQPHPLRQPSRTSPRPPKTLSQWHSRVSSPVSPGQSMPSPQQSPETGQRVDKWGPTHGQSPDAATASTRQDWSPEPARPAAHLARNRN